MPNAIRFTPYLRCIAISVLALLSFSGCTVFQQPLAKLNQPRLKTINRQPHAGREIVKLQKQLQRSADSPELNCQLGQLYFDSAQLIPAARQAEIAIELDPKFAQAWKLRGDIYFTKSRWAEALANYQHSLTLSRDNAELLHRITLCYVELDRPMRAASAVEKLMQQFATSSDLREAQVPLEVLMLYGNVMQEIGQSQQAISSFECACNDADPSSEPFVRLSHAQLLAGKTTESKATLLACLERFPEAIEARQLLDDIASKEDRLTIR